MKVTLEGTDKIVALQMPDGTVVPARIWEGHTEKGIACHAYITRIAVANNLNAEEFQRDLLEVRPPSPAVAAIAPRLIL